MEGIRAQGRSVRCFRPSARLAKWQQHVGTRSGTSPAIVFGRAADGRMLFIMQFAIEQRGPIRHLTWLGSELCDYNAPLLADDFQTFEAGALHRPVGPDHQAAAWTGATRVRFDRPAENAGGDRQPAQSIPKFCPFSRIRAAPILRHSQTTGTRSTPRSARHRPASASAVSSNTSPSMANCASSTCRSATRSRTRSTN